MTKNQFIVLILVLCLGFASIHLSNYYYFEDVKIMAKGISSIKGPEGIGQTVLYLVGAYIALKSFSGIKDWFSGDYSLWNFLTGEKQNGGSASTATDFQPPVRSNAERLAPSGIPQNWKPNFSSPNLENATQLNKPATIQNKPVPNNTQSNNSTWKPNYNSPNLEK